MRDLPFVEQVVAFQVRPEILQVPIVDVSAYLFDDLFGVQEVALGLDNRLFAFCLVVLLEDSNVRLVEGIN